MQTLINQRNCSFCLNYGCPNLTILWYGSNYTNLQSLSALASAQ